VYGIPTYALREKIYLFTTFKPRYHGKHRAGRVSDNHTGEVSKKPK
jgi:hypothetical protein